MISEEKFYDRASKFALLKNTDGKYFTLDEYEKLIKENQTDNNKTLVYLYASDKEVQHSFIEEAKAKAYDVLLLDGQLDPHFINHIESKLKDARFTRVDADVTDKLILKEERKQDDMSEDEKSDLSAVFESQLPDKSKFFVSFEALTENSAPVIITQSEFMRRMKDMSVLGGGAGFYGNLPDHHDMVVNTKHPLVTRIIE